MQTVKKIDIHVHAISSPGLPRPTGDTFATPEELLAMYETLGVEAGLLLPLVSLEGFNDGNTNREIHEIVHRYPDQFYWFCNIDPRQGTNSSDTDFDSMLAYYKALGARGVGEITANLPFDDPRVEALLAACERQNMPITIHIGNLGGEYGLVDPLGLPGLEATLQKFPNLKVLAHSTKFWSEIGGDVTAETRSIYPRGRVAPGGRVVELMRKYPNLYGDLSAGSGCNAILRDPEFSYAFLEEFQDRLFYGTDICSPLNMGDLRVKLGPFLDEAMQNERISYSAYLKICRDNARKLLKKE